jgi:hypothetical protein
MGVSASFAENAQTLINIATAQISGVPLSGSPVTLTATQVNKPIIEFTGTLTANVTVTFPNQGQWDVLNATSGAFTVTLSNGAGATQTSPQGQLLSIASFTGAGILSSGSGGNSGGVSTFNTRSGAVTLQLSDVTGVGGASLANPSFTGTVTAPTATAGTSSTVVATTAFVATSFAPLASPAFTGTPTAPTPSGSSNNTSLATTAFVQTVLSSVTGGLNYQGTWNASTNTPALASGVGTKGFLYVVSVAGSTTLDGNSTWTVGDFVNFNGTVWQRIPAQSASVSSFNTRTGAITLTSTDVTTALGFTPANATSVSGLAPLASPAFTGTPTAPTPTAGDNSTKVATTAFVTGTYAPLASPALTGIPTAPTATTGTNTTQVATTAFVLNSMGSFAPINSPTFTGTVVAPTPTAGDNTTKVATTAFVATSFAPLASPTFTGRLQSPAFAFSTVALGNISGTNTLNLALASEWSATLVGATTFAFTNTLGTNISEVIYLRLTNAGAFAITWPASTKFAGKSAPTFTTGGVDIVGVKYDQVTSTYMVFVVGLNIG